MVPVMDVGGTHVTAGLVSVDRQAVVDDSRRTRELDGSWSAAALLAELVACASSVDAPVNATWGLAVPGPFDYADGIARYHDVGKFDALSGVDVGKALASGISPTPRSVTFLNDAHAFALGEWASDSMAGHERALALTLGTGVGSAFVSAGSIVDSGASVPLEGRADLLVIEDRPLEETVSRRAIVTRYGASADVAEIAARARSGESRAADVLRDAFFALGLAFRPWVARFGATVVVVGGSMAASWDLVEPPLSAGLDGPTLRRSTLGADAQLVGAAIRAQGGVR